MPRVSRQMLELAADQKADGDQMGVGAVALGTRFGRLNASVDRFGKAVAQAVGEVLQDALQVLLYRGAQTFEGRQWTVVPGPANPARQHRRGGGVIGALFEHAAQRLLDLPGARGLQARALQPVHLGDLRVGPVRRVLQRAPPKTFGKRPPSAPSPIKANSLHYAPDRTGAKRWAREDRGFGHRVDGVCVVAGECAGRFPVWCRSAVGPRARSAGL